MPSSDTLVPVVMGVPWPYVAVSFFLGVLVATGLLWAFRRPLFRLYANRELDSARALMAQGRTEEASERLRGLLQSSLFIEDVPQVLARQLEHLYRDSGVKNGFEKFARDLKSIQEDIKKTWSKKNP